MTESTLTVPPIAMSADLPRFKQFINRFTAIPLMGVDLGSAMVKLVVLERSAGRLLLRRCVVAPVEGANPAALLNRLAADAGLSAARVALGLASPEAIAKPCQFPPMPRRELAGAIRMEAEQVMLNGRAPADMAVDWQLLAQDRKGIRGVLAVIPKTVLADRLKLARAAGLRPVVADLEGLAVWNAYWRLVGMREARPQTVLLVNIGAQTTNLVLGKTPDTLVLMRDLRLGGEALTAGQGQEWVSEVRDSLRYARSQAGLRALDSIYLTGGGSTAETLSLLHAELAVPVTRWNPLHQLPHESATPPVDEGVGPCLAVAIGLALRQPL